MPSSMSPLYVVTAISNPVRYKSRYKLYREFAQPENKRTLPARMFLRDEGMIVFKNWMKKGDKTPY